MAGVPRPIASLTSGLLARNGQAKPAMRRQPLLPGGPDAPVGDDGWSDRAVDAALPPVLLAREALAEGLAAAGASSAVALSPAAEARIRAAAARTTRTAFTLRLDPDRHLRLRLAAAADGRSAQHIVTTALDALLAGRPDVESLARRLSPAGQPDGGHGS